MPRTYRTSTLSENSKGPGAYRARPVGAARRCVGGGRGSRLLNCTQTCVTHMERLHTVEGASRPEWACMGDSSPQEGGHDGHQPLLASDATPQGHAGFWAAEPPSHGDKWLAEAFDDGDSSASDSWSGQIDGISATASSSSARSDRVEGGYGLDVAAANEAQLQGFAEAFDDGDSSASDSWSGQIDGISVDGGDSGSLDGFLRDTIGDARGAIPSVPSTGDNGDVRANPAWQGWAARPPQSGFMPPSYQQSPVQQPQPHRGSQQEIQRPAQIEQDIQRLTDLCEHRSANDNLATRAEVFRLVETLLISNDTEFFQQRPLRLIDSGVQVFREDTMI
eukprot:COSAG02_NODE_7523_length_2974_cov_7.116870_3_plen_334_part_01